jgi:hypothetical protein
MMVAEKEWREQWYDGAGDKGKAKKIEQIKNDMIAKKRGSEGLDQPQFSA